MRPQRKKRLIFVFLIVLGISAAAALACRHSREPAVFLHALPSRRRRGTKGRAFRVGGLVETGSVKRESDGLTVHFTVTDTAKSIPITYKGILPDLFREGQGIVATAGSMRAAPSSPKSTRQARRKLHAARSFYAIKKATTKPCTSNQDRKP